MLRDVERERWIAELLRDVRENFSFFVRLRFKAKSDERQWALERDKEPAETGPAGQAIRVVDPHNDRKEHELAEGDSRHSRERYRMLHESLVAAFRQVFIDMDIDEESAEAHGIYRRTPRRSPDAMRAPAPRKRMPERRHAFQDAFVRERVVAREQAIPEGYFDICEMGCRKEDGAVVPAKPRTIPSRGASARPNAMRAVVLRASGLKQAEQALRPAHDKLEARVEERTAELTRADDAPDQSEQQLRDFSSRLLAAQEKERKRIAHELHDSIGGTLSAIKFGIENTLAQMREGRAVTPEDLERLVRSTQHAIDESRRIYMGLRPSILDDLGLIATITWFLRQFEDSCKGIRVQKSVELQQEEIPGELETVLFRVIQEAFHNIAKHSRADRAFLSLRKENNRISLSIRDSGIGFAPGNLSLGATERGGLGLESMRERVESSGGALSIRSIPGKGTTIHAVWDLDRIR